MRRDLVAQITRLGRHGGLHLLAQCNYLLLQLVNPALLPVYSLIQFFQQIFGKAEFCFHLFETGVHGKFLNVSEWTVGDGSPRFRYGNSPDYLLQSATRIRRSNQGVSILLAVILLNNEVCGRSVPLPHEETPLTAVRV